MDANQPPSEDPGLGPERGRASDRPRWRSTLVWIVAIAVVGALLAVIIWLHASGTLGPGIH